MALKDIFTMVKADRYTADGREEVIKAREAEIEDVKYNNGDISQKTGLMKTPNGWVKPPKGKTAGKGAETKPNYQITEKGGKFYATGHQFKDGSQLHAGPFGSEEEVHKFMNNGVPYRTSNGKAPGAKTGPGTNGQNVHGAEVDKIYERQLKRIKELKAKGFTDEQIDNDKIIKQTKEDMRNVGKKPESKPAGTTKPKLPKGVNKVIPISPEDKLDYGKSHYRNPNSEATKEADKIVNHWFESEGKEIMPDLYIVNEKGEAKAFSTRAGLVNRLAYLIENDKPYDLTYISRKDTTGDSAPRVLTGDTKIRVRRQTKDGTYTPETINGFRDKLDQN